MPIKEYENWYWYQGKELEKGLIILLRDTWNWK